MRRRRSREPRPRPVEPLTLDGARLPHRATQAHAGFSTPTSRAGPGRDPLHRARREPARTRSPTGSRPPILHLPRESKSRVGAFLKQSRPRFLRGRAPGASRRISPIFRISPPPRTTAAHVGDNVHVHNYSTAPAPAAAHVPPRLPPHMRLIEHALRGKNRSSTAARGLPGSDRLGKHSTHVDLIKQTQPADLRMATNLIPQRRRESSERRHLKKIFRRISFMESPVRSTRHPRRRDTHPSASRLRRGVGLTQHREQLESPLAARNYSTGPDDHPARPGPSTSSWSTGVPARLRFRSRPHVEEVRGPRIHSFRPTASAASRIISTTHQTSSTSHESTRHSVRSSSGPTSTTNEDHLLRNRVDGGSVTIFTNEKQKIDPDPTSTDPGANFQPFSPLRPSPRRHSSRAVNGLEGRRMARSR